MRSQWARLGPADPQDSLRALPAPLTILILIVRIALEMWEHNTIRCFDVFVHVDVSTKKSLWQQHRLLTYILSYIQYECSLCFFHEHTRSDIQHTIRFRVNGNSVEVNKCIRLFGNNTNHISQCTAIIHRRAPNVFGRSYTLWNEKCVIKTKNQRP